MNRRNYIQGKIPNGAERRLYGNSHLRRGLKRVHIGGDTWLYGRQSIISHRDLGRTLHCVIYGPDNKEHHVYGDDVAWICRPFDYKYNEYGTINRHGNRALESNVKAYILTSILDKKENWCFDLSKIPRTGPLKVVYENGMVYNVDFDGTFYQADKKWLGRVFGKVNAIGYRLESLATFSALETFRISGKNLVAIMGDMGEGTIKVGDTVIIGEERRVIAGVEGVRHANFPEGPMSALTIKYANEDDYKMLKAIDVKSKTLTIINRIE